MKKYGVFDVLGPIMIGPSSSHTAGAARLGLISKKILNNNFKKVNFYLHGSFAETAKGHGTDRALLAGVLGMHPDDENLPNSFEIAKKKGINYSFKEIDLDAVHPNTVKIEFILKNKKKYSIIGSSIGGGNILITNLNGTEVSFSGSHPTLLIRNNDTEGVIAFLSNLLYKNKINIGTMKVTRKNRIATMVIEVDGFIEDSLVKEISEYPDILYVQSINLE